MLANKIQKVDKLLKNYLTPNSEYEEKIYEAMKYSIFAGGKRIRPILMIEAYNVLNNYEKAVEPFAVAIEMIHTYSLIHDDLPAMDDDDYRRGKPTNHKVFGEGFAILSGDALLNKAYEVLIENILRTMKQEYIEAASVISKAAGVMGMIGGQSIDLFFENKEITINKLKEMHDKKTGALIKASLISGAIIGKASKDDIARIGLYGELIGRAFQITDDILDVKGTSEKMGKTIGKDLKNKKSTYVTYYGLEKSIELAQKTAERAKEIISVYGDKSKLFVELADYIMNRDS